MIRTSDSYY